MLTWIVVNDLLKNWTGSTENNPVSFELSLIIRDQSNIRVSAVTIKILEHKLKMFREGFPRQATFIRHCLITISTILYTLDLKLLEMIRTDEPKYKP